jgi:hypothetical protein
VAVVALVAAACLLLAAVLATQHTTHQPLPVEFLLLPVFLFGLVEAPRCLLPANGHAEERLPSAPVRPVLRQRPPPLLLP